MPIDFDSEDQVLEGEILELSIRQFFIAPGRSQPWLDVDLLMPYYPDEAQLLESELAPFPRTTQVDGGFGPAHGLGQFTALLE